MKTSGMGSSDRLPITRSLTLVYALSLVVALIMTVASVVGLLYRTRIYPTDDLLLAFIPNDIINLAVGLPILLISMWLARRGKLIGLLCWPGALFYMPYIYVPYVLAVPFGVLFLPYLVLVTLSAYTVIGIVASIDGDAVRQRLDGAVPVKVGGGILIGLAILVIVRQTALIVTALTSQEPVDTLEFAVWIGDFALECPALLVVGLTLWRRQALGYVTGAGLFLQYSMIAFSVIPLMVFQSLSTASPINTVDIIALLVMTAICFAPFALFARGAASDRRSSPA